MFVELWGTVWNMQQYIEILMICLVHYVYAYQLCEEKQLLQLDCQKKQRRMLQ